MHMSRSEHSKFAEEGAMCVRGCQGAECATKEKAAPCFFGAAQSCGNRNAYVSLQTVAKLPRMVQCVSTRWFRGKCATKEKAALPIQGTRPS